MPLPVVYTSFPTRESRSEFVADHFSQYLDGTVLDVGCFEAPLRDLLKAATYTGIDFCGNPDLKIDLETMTRLPFDKDSYRAVLCIDTLEHLENLHFVFDEVVRVSSQFIIASLPNCWCDARCPIEKGRGQFGHYGLPTTRPQDRHKWFFSMSEAREFTDAKARAHGIEIIEQFVAEKPRPAITRWLRSIRYSGNRYQNRYARTLWTVFEKKRVRT